MSLLARYIDLATGIETTDTYTPNTERYQVASRAATVYAVHRCLRCGLEAPYALGHAECHGCRHLYLELR
jgi:hypothetical protein